MKPTYFISEIARLRWFATSTCTSDLQFASSTLDFHSSHGEKAPQATFETILTTFFKNRESNEKYKCAAGEPLAPNILNFVIL